MAVNPRRWPNGKDMTLPDPTNSRHPRHSEVSQEVAKAVQYFSSISSFDDLLSKQHYSGKWHLPTFTFLRSPQNINILDVKFRLNAKPANSYRFEFMAMLWLVTYKICLFSQFLHLASGRSIMIGIEQDVTLSYDKVKQTQFWFYTVKLLFRFT